MPPRNWSGPAIPGEWDLVPYPPKFKTPILQAFDGMESPNQHIYYFKSQTENVVSNDAVLARLFIGTLKGITFEWFMKLPGVAIKNWGDLEKLFLTHFVTPRFHGYGDVTATYIRRSELPSRI